MTQERKFDQQNDQEGVRDLATQAVPALRLQTQSQATTTSDI